MLTGWSHIDHQFAALDEFRRQFEQILNDYDTGRPGQTFRSTTWPRLNLFDKGDLFVLQAELPGVAREDISIQGNQEAMTLSGERKVNVPEGFTLHRQERAGCRFARAITFPVKVDMDKASAELKNGLLTFTVPKLPEARPRSIQISVS